MKTDTESLWFLAFAASKCESLSPSTAVILAFIFFLSCLILNLVFWAHPGGPAWGKYKWRNPTSTKSRSSIPGPKGAPVIGSMNLMTGLAHHKIAAAAEACGGKRLMAFSIGETRAIVTCNHEVAKEILNSATFADRPANETAYNLMFRSSIGFAPYGVYWQTLRKIISTHLFSPKQIKASEYQRMEIASEMVSVFGSSRDGFSVRNVLKLASLENMMFSVFGRRYGLCSVNSETEELSFLVDEGYDLLGKLNLADHLSFLTDFDVQKIRLRCSRLVPRVRKFVGRIVAEHKAETSKLNRDLVDVLLSLQGSDRLSEADMIAVLWEMIFRGTDTVAVLIEWILARVVLHPDVQSKAHEELDRVVGRGRTVAESDLSELVYLTAVIKEVLRFHPPGPLLSWSRLSIRDSTVDGYHVPAGTTAMVNMWAIMRDPAAWDDPLDFKPERFMNRELSVMGSDLRLAPFGSGRRSCPGKILGMTTVTYWVARLLHDIEFMASGPSVDLSEVLRLSCEMAHPLQIRAKLRR
ncbi:hypothetical protein F511_05607 [Dorcoceras hygrometricum]|uniref:Uncharacterized protein n=1 Tax=Dorcoceras hygrometricum TaxID=472368 RepID=A0A2Z7ARC3_9LAMI|nr:hypothetical protein F511_05607 [Dorcoceras hygrometricum]